MILRNMRSADYDQAYALWLSCKGMGINAHDDSRTGIERFLRRNGTTCFVAEEEGTIIGTILAGHDGRRGYIYHMAVSPSCRRRGIGRALTEAALSALREEGVLKVGLLVYETNAAGNAFWEQMGFSRREDVAYRNRILGDMSRAEP